MAEIATVARPYAEATFMAALEANRLAPVGEALEIIAAAARDEQMRSALSNPKVSAQQKKDLFAAVVGERLDSITRNLVAILIDGHRDVLIGSIAEQYDELKREHEKELRVRISSAQALTDEQRAQIVEALERRYGKKIEAEMDVDPELLGGARVQVGDQVINASMRDALAQMAAALAR
jgi:F-type H+-transporting ATPase subunit delta